MKATGMLVMFLAFASAAPREVSQNDDAEPAQRNLKAKKGKKSSDEDFLCNTFDAECDMTAAEAQLAYLSTYEQLEAKLAELAEYSQIRIQVGPLIQNGDSNGGLIDIDVPLLENCNPDYVNCDVCGTENTSPTLREAMTCTVTNDPLGFPQRGNTDPAKIGKSTQGRDILAVRVGTGDTKVVVVAQQHGNEAASTEGCLNFLQEITTKKGKKHRSLLKKLDILFIMRANPDGGDPAGDNLAENYPQYLAGAQYVDDKYFFRENVDPRSGGAFGAVDGDPNSEPGFAGVVGRGYDLNRYHFFNLADAIRPVENQAIVAAVTAFQPQYTMDLHGDAAKSACVLDPAIIGTAFGFLPIAECVTDPAVPTLGTSRKDMVEASIFAGGIPALGATTEQEELLSRAIGSTLWEAIGQGAIEGHVVRFSQTQTGGGVFNNGVFWDAIRTLPVISTGLEVRNYGVAVKPVILGFEIGASGPVPDIGIGVADIEPCFLPDNICLHQEFVEEYLFAVLETLQESDDDTLADAADSFCSIGAEISNVASIPAALGWPPAVAVETIIQVPGGGQFGVPTAISGNCPEE